MGRFLEKYIGPFVVPLGILAVIVGVLAGIGEMYLALFQPGSPDRLDRPELWASIGILLGVIAVIALISTRPKGSLGPLEKEVVVGSTPFWAEDGATHVTPAAVKGEPGTVADIGAGFTLYAQSGPLARVIDVLPGGNDYGKRFRGFLHAQGIGHAAKEMWVPFEAVSAVYPESQTAFLAIKGDETEAFGWTTPPESVAGGTRRHVSASDRVK